VRGTVISPRAFARLLDALALFVERVETQERDLRLGVVCRRETGVEDHRPRCAYAAAKDALMLVSAFSANRTIAETTDVITMAPNTESL